MAGRNELSVELYADAFRSLHPKLAHTLLFERIRQAKLLNDELSEHFRERISIEEQYIRALAKLAKKPITTAASSHTSHAPQSAQFKYSEQDEEQHQDAHGRVAKILQDQLTHAISSHENYHAQLQTQVEAALRKPLLQQAGGAQQHEAEFRSTEEQTLKLVKSYEESEQKLNRSTQKLNSSSSNLRKIQSLQTRQYEDQLHFNHAKQTWAEHAPNAFRVYQSVDKQRLMDLFETLTKFETIQADHSRQLMEIAERATMSLLSFDIQENMQRFALINGAIADPSTTTTTTTTHPNGNQPEQQQQQQQQPQNSPQPPDPLPLTSTPAPGHSRQPTAAETHSRQSTMESHSRQPTTDLHSRQPTTELHSRQPTTDLDSRQPTLSSQSPARSSDSPFESLADVTHDIDEELRPSVRSPSLRPSALTTPVLGSSSAIPTSASVARGYDPNHPEIPKLNAPNISVPIRSTPASPSKNAQNGLPPRTLYVQPLPSTESISPASPGGRRPSADTTRTRPSNYRPTHSKAPSTSQSITEKLFGRGFTQMLSRNPSHQSTSNLKQAKSRRLSQTNLPSVTQLSHPRRNDQNQTPPPREQSQPRRSSSMMDTDSSGNILGLQSPAPIPSAAAEGATPAKLSWSSGRLGQFLPSPGPLLKRKISQSNRRWKPSTRDQGPSASSSVQPSRVDADGFTIPPEHRDRAPWEQDRHTEVLSLARTDSSVVPNSDSSRTNVTGAGPDRPMTLQRSESMNSRMGGGVNSLAIKPSATLEKKQDSEAERQAAIQRVQSTLASSPSAGLVTRRSNAALRGRRGDGRGATMYDVSPSPSAVVSGSTSHARSGSVSGGLPSVPTQHPRLDLSPAPTQPLSPTTQTLTFSSPSSIARSVSDNGVAQPLSTNFSHLYSSSPEMLASTLPNPSSLPVARGHSLHPALPPPPPIQEQQQASRSNSTASAVSPPNLTGFLSLAPSPLPRTNGPSLAASPPNRNPFLNMSLGSDMTTSLITPSPHTAGPHHDDDGGNTRDSQHLLSVSEKLNVLMHQGTVTKLLIIGDVRISRAAVGRLSGSVDTPQVLPFVVSGLDVLEKVIFPNDLLSPTGSSSSDDEEEGPQKTQKKSREYVLDVARLQTLFDAGTSQAQQPDEISVLKYRVLIDASKAAADGATQEAEAAARHVPIMVVPRWRCREDKTELVVVYKESRAFRSYQQTLFAERGDPASEEEEEGGGGGGEGEGEGEDGGQYSRLGLQALRVKTCVYSPAAHPAPHPVTKKVTEFLAVPAPARVDNAANEILWDLSAQKDGLGNTMDQDAPSRCPVQGLDGKIVCRFVHPVCDDDSDDADKHADARQAALDASCGPLHLHWELCHPRTLPTLSGFLIRPAPSSSELLPQRVHVRVACDTFLCR